MKFKVFWLQIFLFVVVSSAPFIGLEYSANDMAAVASLAVMLALVSYLGRPMETVSDMRHRIFSGESAPKKFILSYLLPIWMVLFLLLTGFISLFL